MVYPPMKLTAVDSCVSPSGSNARTHTKYFLPGCKVWAGGLTEVACTRLRQTRAPSAVTTRTSYATESASGCQRMMKSEGGTVAPGRGDSTTGRETPGDAPRTEVSV